MKPRIGISRCLLGDDVRYDGTNKRSTAVMALGAQVEWVPVCPEVEIGLGTPREPIELRRVRGELRLVGVGTGLDHTAAMQAYAVGRVRILSTLDLSGFILALLAAERISGFVLKARSPSCGPAGVLVHDGRGNARPIGRGLFAEALAAAIPGLPLIDEEALDDTQTRTAFIERVLEFADSAGTRK